MIVPLQVEGRMDNEVSIMSLQSFLLLTRFLCRYWSANYNITIYKIYIVC